MAVVSFAFVLGVLGVLQGAINRVVSRAWGLTPAILLNAIVIILVSFAFYFLVKSKPAWFPEFFHVRTDFTRWSWYFLLPGLCGFVIVAGIPFAMDRIGALNVFIAIVAAQMLASLAWDRLVDGIPVSLPRLAGALLAAAGALVSRIRS